MDIKSKDNYKQSQPEQTSGVDAVESNKPGKDILQLFSSTVALKDGDVRNK